MARRTNAALPRYSIAALLVLLVGCTEHVPACNGGGLRFDPAANTCSPPPDGSSPLPDVGDGGEVADAGPCGMACTGMEPVCDEVSRSCVGCLVAGDCMGTTPLCDPETNTCVACLADNDCTNPSAGRCDAGSCVPCTMSEQCTVAGAGLCESGTCLECTVTDETPCGGNSCDPALNTCTDTLLGGTSTCGGCVADSECVADHRCVPMTFSGADHGNYCMKIAATGCARPFSSALVDRTSLSGAVEADYCGIDEAMVSCEAVVALQMSQGCPGGAADCMADGARCETVGVIADQCTYTCGVANDCPAAGAASTCGGGYCGGS